MANLTEVQTGNARGRGAHRRNQPLELAPVMLSGGSRQFNGTVTAIHLRSGGHSSYSAPRRPYLALRRAWKHGSRVGSLLRVVEAGSAPGRVSARRPWAHTLGELPRAIANGN
jgi:hypothetical protein